MMRYDFEFRSRRSNVMGKHGMVASSQPLASLIGLDILRNGGNAADAAVAMSAMLTVVEPFSTGIGGDCFVLYWDAATKTVYALNGSGPAAQSAKLEDLHRSGYQHFPLFTGHAVSVPGSVGAWAALLERFGKLSLADTFSPAIKTAFEGYAVTEWIAAGWRLMEKKLLRSHAVDDLPDGKENLGPEQPSGHEFLIDGRSPKAGEWMQIPYLGDTLKSIAAQGPEFFYSGEFSEKLCQHVQQYGGWLEPADLAGYTPEWVEPIYADYNGVRLYECPPNGQGLAAIVAAKIADGFDLAGMDETQRIHTLIECVRLGFQEAFTWVADPDFHSTPYDRLFSDPYIRSRRDLIQAKRAIRHLPIETHPVGDDTVYLSVVDGEGNACSFINSLCMPGGTGLVVPGTGVLLQNRASLFSMDPDHPNALVGGKRPFHTIIPALITQEGELFACFGVMGGLMQPQGHIQVLSNMVDLGHSPQQALDMPRFCINVLPEGGVGADDPGGQVSIEKGFDFETLAELRRMGHRVTPISGQQRLIFGGGQIIVRDPQTGILTGGSDPRKDGCALGW
jgi:gamma-glutamyltranspeptidase / glutathione hydrolase